ncbi:hypothetical protein DDI_0244 [Dickeya dianthicola RNS04.9]|nr:hypothetical protein DDI_0244 [Dickeya dianthicola RNS04.9]
MHYGFISAVINRFSGVSGMKNHRQRHLIKKRNDLLTILFHKK